MHGMQIAYPSEQIEVIIAVSNIERKLNTKNIHKCRERL